MHQGACLCKAVSFKVKGELGSNDACHCRSCRKWTGHYLVSAEVNRDDLIIKGEAHLCWYPSSDKVRRGFCSCCGSSLFFDPLDKSKHNWIAIALGAFDTATNTQLEKHIFVAEKGDYYRIDDGFPQNER